MEHHQKRHITRYFYDLISLTDCNTTCTSILRQNYVLSDEDKAELDSIPNSFKKAEKLYELLMTKKDSYCHLLTALNESCQTGALVILNKLGEQTEETNSIDACDISLKRIKNDRDPLLFDVLAPVFNFTGREPQLIALHQKLQESDQSRAVISQMASIVGLGGIGKTELARKYIQEYVEKFYDGNAVWISAQNEEKLNESFRNVASNKLNISAANGDIRTIVDRVYAYFNRQRVLFIFDNAESTEYLQMFMPLHLSSSTTLPYILITSRDREWSFSTEVLELDAMTEKDAICFVKKCLEDKQDDAQVLKLVNRVQCYPLALSQSVSYIKQRQFLGSFTISQYLDTFDENLEKLLNTKRPKAEFNTYKETTLTTWTVTTEQISNCEENGQLASDLLNSIAYFVPEKIPMNLFSHLKNGDMYQEAVFLLVKYSMINVQREQKTISVHRLVQDVTRMQLKQNKMEESIIRNTMKCFPGTMEFCHVSHACSVFKHCAAHKSVVIDFKSLPFKILSAITSYGVDPTVLIFAAELRELLLKHIHIEDIDFLRLERKIAELEYKVNAFQNSLNTLKRILPFFEANKTGLFSEDEILLTKRKYALVLKEIGRRTESLESLIQSYQKYKDLFGVNHSQIIQALVDIIECLIDLGHFEEHPPINADYLLMLSEELRGKDPQKFISVLKIVYGNTKFMIDSNYNYANVLCEVANCLRMLGDKSMARIILREIYEIGKNSNDSRIQNVSINSLNTLGVIEFEERNYEDAYRMYQEVLTFSSTRVESRSLKTLKTKRNLFLVQRDRGQLKTALEGFQDVLKTMLTYYPHASDVAELELDIAITLYKMKRYNESLALFLELKTKLQVKFPQLEKVAFVVNYGIETLQNCID